MKKLILRLAAATLGLTGALHGLSAGAEEYPNRPIRLIVPYSAGGGIDFIARNVGLKMAEALGQPVIIDNRPGASSILGAEVVARAAPDGHTLLIGDSTTFAVNPTLYPKLGYDPQKDFAPISLSARFNMMLVVNPDVVPASSLAELIDLAKKNPGNISYGSAGTGTPHHLGMELFQQRTGVSLNHIPYKGGAPALQDLLAGHLGLMLLDMPTATPHLKSAKLRILATATAGTVAALAPVPTAAQAGIPDFSVVPTIAIAAPAGTPEAIIAKLNAAYAKAVMDPEIRAKMINAGMEPLHSTPAEMANFMRGERTKWATVVRQGNVQVR